MRLPPPQISEAANHQCRYLGQAPFHRYLQSTDAPRRHRPPARRATRRTDRRPDDMARGA